MWCFGDLERQMVRLGNWAIALVCGSMAVFTLWYCLLNYSLIPYAAVFLLIALALEAANHFFLSPPQSRAKRR
jgi:hypothetical protein